MESGKFADSQVGETKRHTGHSDIVRELIDGQMGYRPDIERLLAADDQWWARYRDRAAAVTDQN